jgi:MFS family permease
MTITGSSGTELVPDTRTPEQRREVRRVILSGYLGSTIEFYDFLLYGSAAALVFPQVFFGGLDPFSQVILSFGTFAAGYVARPVGGILFGHFGDRLGRKKMLMLTMLIMGLASFSIGLIPGSASIGGAAAVLLVTLRVAQGIAVGGEWGGAALMALEHAESRRRGFAASFINAGAPSGALLGGLLLGLFATLPEDQFLSWGWRIPFLLSAVLLVVGLWVRLRVSESPVFIKAAEAAEKAEKAKPALPLWSVLRRPKALILTTLGAGAAFAFQVTMATFVQAYAAQHGTPRSAVLFGHSLSSFIGIFAVIAAGWLSDRYGRRPVLMTGSLAFTVLTVPLFSLWGSGNALLVALGFVIGVSLQSLVYGPLGSFISEQFGTGARYTGASLGYQLATLLGGGFTPALLAMLYRNSGGSTTPVALFLMTMGVISVGAVFLIREGRHHDLTAVEH